MKKLLIVSATPFSNFDLSEQIKVYLEKKSDLSCQIISLEDLNLPLFTPSLEVKIKEQNNFPKEIAEIKSMLVSADATIWCSPEYNGGISPIITNTIAWVSRIGDDWKEGFDGKKTLICSSSGGNGNNFVKGFSIQLSYLGANILEKSLIKTKKNGIKTEEFTEVLDSFHLFLKN